ncbi:MAG: hypothetical protein RQ826_17725, partial [Xanthomonadales bacterium]|nr:hypothetical protein [Xanthomonadales bacterium]
GRTIPAAPQTRFRRNAVLLRRRNRESGLDISPETTIPLWEGEKMDSSMAIEALLWLETDAGGSQDTRTK